MLSSYKKHLQLFYIWYNKFKDIQYTGGSICRLTKSNPQL